MKETGASVNELVKTSLRVGVMLILALCALMVLAVFCLWALHGLVNQADLGIRSQFQHLTFDLLEQEEFLNKLVTPGAGNRVVPEKIDLLPQDVKLLVRKEGVDVYLAKGGRVGLPYTITVPIGAVDEASISTEGSVQLAGILARHFGQARGGRVSEGSQAFLVDLDSRVQFTIPCLPVSVYSEVVDRSKPKCGIAIDAIRGQLEADYKGTNQDDDALHWRRIGVSGDGSLSAGVLLYRRIEVDENLWSGSHHSRRLTVGTYLQLAPSYDMSSGAGRTILLELRKHAGGLRDSRFDLHAVHGDEIKSEYRIRRDGLYFATSNNTGWDAGYLVPWGEFFRAADWQLVAFLLLVVLSPMASIVLYRRHSRTVVIPAKKSHELVVESAAFSQAVIDVSKVAVVGLDVETHSILVRNKLADEWLGDDESILALMSGCVEFGSLEGEGLRESQRLFVGERYLSVSYRRTGYRGHKVLLAAFSDVTAHHHVNAALELAKRTADDANAGKTVFLASMSHEIRTPLYGILGTIELLGLTDLAVQQRAYLDTVQTSAAGLLGIIGDILDVSKIESRQMTLKVSDFDPVELTANVARTYSANAEAKALQLYIVVASDVPPLLQGDELRITQVLNNLISNAIKFSEAGWIRLSLGVASSEHASVTLVWEVTDTGLGIPEGQLVSLFQPFYQVPGRPQTASGTGLGLYICRSLCDLMSGEIQVNSAPGRGSTFRVSLPLELSVSGTLAAESEFLSDQVVWVRAPIAELAQNVSDWLGKAGAKHRTATGAFTARSHGGVLVEISPDRMPPVAWDGPRVSCTPAGPESPQWGMSGVHVNEYALRSIVSAVLIASKGNFSSEGAALFNRRDELDAISTEMVNTVSDSYRPAAGLERLGLRVLVAEDNVVNRALLVRQLEQLGCMVSICADGVEVLARWDDGDFDVLLTDINMPRIDGYEVVRDLRSRGVGAPIIGITASIMQSERDFGLALGFDAWVTKPVDLATLYDVLRHACAGQKAIIPQRGFLFQDWQVGQEFSGHLMSVFTDAMQVDVPLAWDALTSKDTEALKSILHRMRGALAVMKFDELAFFSEVLEGRIASDGLTPVLWNAVRSTLQEIESVVAGIS